MCGYRCVHWRSSGEELWYSPRGKLAGELRGQQWTGADHKHERFSPHCRDASDLEGDRGADELLGADGLAGGAVVERVLVPLVQQPGDDRDDPAVPLWERGQHLHDDRGVCGGDTVGELSQHCSRGEPAGELRHQQRADPGGEHGREEDHRGDAGDLEGDRGADELLGADGLAGGAVIERVLVPLVQQPGDDRDDPAIPLWERGQHLHDDRGVCGGDTAGELSQHCSRGEPAGELRHQQRTDPGGEHGREEDHRGNASDLEGDRGADELLGADGLAGGAVVERVLVPLVQQPGDDRDDPAVPLWERGQHLHDDRGVCGGDTAGELSQHCPRGQPAGELRDQQRADPGGEHGREEDHRGDASDLEGDRGADELLRVDGLAGGAVVERVLVPLVQQPGDDCHEPAVQIRRAVIL
jgi:hypothetical protein